MNNVTFNTQDVEVTSVFFSQNGERYRFVSYPRKLVYKGREYVLAEA
jgi:hypothetical protein